MNAQSLLEQIAEATPDGMAFIDASGRISFWNQAAGAMFGHPREQAIARRLDELVLQPRPDAEPPDPAGARSFQTIARCADGTLLYVNVGMRPLRPAADAAAAVVSLADVTLSTVRRDGRVLSARFGGLLDSVPDAIVIVNDIGRIVLANHQAEQMFGHSRQDLVGAALEMLLPERLRGGHGEHRARYLAHPHARPMGAGLQLLGLRKNGEEFPVEISLSPLETEFGGLAISAIRDITSRRQFEQALEDKNVELQRANRTKDRFQAAMSHELRSPLNAIIGFTGLLQMRLPGPLTVDQEKQLGMVQSSGQHLLSLINDLLDLARIDSGAVEVNLSPIDAGAAIEQVLTTLRPMAQARQLGLEALLPAARVSVMAETRALQEILLNLTSNAIKFTEAGQVSIELATVPAAVGGREVHIRVRDTGVGMNSDELARLFSAFTRMGDASQRGRVEGTGLGLYLCRKLAELQQGRISVSSEPGQGSCFTLMLREGPAT